MGESIDKQTVIDLIQILTFSRCMEYGEYVGKEYLVSSDILINAIKELPPAEPKRKTGRWIKPTGMMPPEYHGHYECSECGAWAMCTYHKSKVRLTRYCPGCGIKMGNADV